MADGLFRREKTDIHLDVPIGLQQAVLGGSVVIPTLDGEVDLKVGGAGVGARPKA